MTLPPSPASVDLLAELLRLRDDLVAIEQQEAQVLRRVAPRYGLSARNLLHVIAFHRCNHPGLVTALRERGLNSLEGCQAHLAASLASVIAALTHLEGHAAPSADPPPDGPAHGQALELQRSHAVELLGPSAQGGSRVIMVTLPGEAAPHTGLISELVEAGMGIARINCAHDSPPIWQSCIDQVRQANQTMGRSARIAMDLAGPKLRTGPLPSAPGVVDGRPRRDRYGRLLIPARLRAIPLNSSRGGVAMSGPSPEESVLPILDEGWAVLERGQRLRGRDASGRWRELLVKEADPQGLLLSCQQRCRFTEGLRFVQEGGEGFLVVAPLSPLPGERLLRSGDRLRLTAPGMEEPEADAIPCTCPEVFSSLRPGEPVLFDEGRIHGRIEAVNEKEVVVMITKARPQGSRLRSDKGINLPQSNLSIPSLTAKDLHDLDFAVAQADILNLSFVRSVSDIQALHQHLKQQDHAPLGVVLKVENRQAFLNLPRLLLAAMEQQTPIGVMIARGDLAVECGWEDLALIQEEVLHLCSAAHVPCIWATEILDSMLHDGLPTRPEITDAAMGTRAEALMLNKGPNIKATLHTLQRVVGGMETLLPEHSRHRDQWLSCLAFSSL